MDRQQRSAVDNLASFRYMFERFVLNCQKNYVSGGHITTTDEQPLGFRGRYRFCMYMPKKKQQIMDLKYMPLRMLEYDIHLYLKFMLENII
jgi:hypothetical protein